jgi:hypothetical protein
MNERSDWEKHKNYPPAWSWATSPERAGIVAVWLASSAVALVIALGVLLVVGESVEGISRYKSEHDRCLQKATTGYEIKQCR